MQVILSDGSSFFVLRDVQLETGLYAGVTLSQEAIAKAMVMSDRRAAEAAALSLLSRAPHTRDGLRLKLLKRGHGDEVSQIAIGRMAELGYVDDRRFAADWIAVRLERHPEGRRAMIANLRRRGIERCLAEEVVDDLVSIELEEECLLAVVNRHGSRYGGRKLASKLASLGFPFDLIRRHIPDLDT